MTISTNCRIRFCDNNFLAPNMETPVFSSEASGYPMLNALNNIRSKTWKPSGYFLIDGTNNIVPTSLGDVVLTSGGYTTGALLATEIKNKLNALSAGWDVTFSNNKFSITKSTSVTLTTSNKVNTVWDTIGFTIAYDLTGVSFVSNEQRRHAYEFVKFDLQYGAKIDFFALLAPIQYNIGLSYDATVRLQANNIDNWTTPPLDMLCTFDEYGVFQFLDAVDSTYRYWQIIITDKTGTEDINIANIYLGDYVDFATKNISTGFNYSINDPSTEYRSEGGQSYFIKKDKYFELKSSEIGYLDKQEQATLNRMWAQLGKTTPFYVSIDPKVNVSTTASELTKYVVFDDSPRVSHVIRDLYNFSFTLREML